MGDQLIQQLAKLVPLITDPISLVAFAVFVVVFLLTKLILASGVLRPVTKKQGFAILNKILNIAGLALIMIILFAFGAHIYSERQRTSLRSKDVRTARRHLIQLADIAAEIKSSPTSFSTRERLIELQPAIFAVGQVLDPDLAISEIKRVRDLYGLDEISPALLAISSASLTEILGRPFNYLPPGPSSNMFGYPSKYGGDDFWSLDEETAEELIAREYLERLKHAPTFPFKDLIFFLAAIDPEDWDSTYPGSLVSDAAFYVPIREALINEDFAVAAEQADRFIRRFRPSSNEQTDDAAVLKTIAAEGMGDGLLALRSIDEGLALPDGDMKEWFESERIRIIEHILQPTELTKLEADASYSEHRSVLAYTRGHHLIARGDYDAGVTVLRSLLQSPNALCPSLMKASNADGLMGDGTWGAIPTCVPVDILRDDIQRIEVLNLLTKDGSPAGRFRYGIALGGDELVHYNQILGPGRSSRKERTPSRYFEERNNYWLSALAFREAANTSDPELRQKALYKLGRCYQQLANRSAFFYKQIAGHERADFAQLAVRTFLEAQRVHPAGALADDALAEAGLNTWLLEGNSARSKRILERVVEEYPSHNAADNALFWLAQSADDQGDEVRAAAYWARLAVSVTSSRLRRLVEEQSVKASR
jgi:hypothetical protein